MSDSEQVTRKLPGGKKIVEKRTVATKGQGSTNTTEVERAEKKRKLVNGDIKYVHRL